MKPRSAPLRLLAMLGPVAMLCGVTADLRPTIGASVADAPGETPGETQASSFPQPPPLPQINPPPLPQINPTPPYDRPNLSPGGSLSAFIAEQGYYFLYLYSYAFETSSGSWEGDLGLGAGFGLGSSRELVALEVGVNQFGLEQVNRGGSLDVRVARDIPISSTVRLAIAGGALSVLAYGDADDTGPSAFVVSSLEVPIRLRSISRRMQVNVGYGDNQFESAASADLFDQGIFASVGIDVLENLGFSLGGSTVGLSTKLSYIPWRGTPFSINVLGNNLSNRRDAGRSAVLSFTWGGTLPHHP